MSKASSSYKILLFSLLFVLASLQTATAQEDKEKKNSLYQSISTSFVYGVQAYNDNMIYNPGYSVQFSVGKRVHRDVAIGIGSGYVNLNDEHFVPIYFEVIGNKKKKSNTPFIKLQAGYSIAWNENAKSNDSYELNGGLYFNAGLGRKIRVNDNYSVMLNWSICHQFAEMEYSVFGEKKFSDTLNYDMLQLSVGLLLH